MPRARDRVARDRAWRGQDVRRVVSIRLSKVELEELDHLKELLAAEDRGGGYWWSHDVSRGDVVAHLVAAELARRGVTGDLSKPDSPTLEGT
jgi:hypothetical protein